MQPAHDGHTGTPGLQAHQKTVRSRGGKDAAHWAAADADLRAAFDRAHEVTTLTVTTRALADVREALDRDDRPGWTTGMITAEHDQEMDDARICSNADLRVALEQMLTSIPTDTDRDGLADFRLGTGDVVLLLECVRTQRTALRGLRYGSGRHSTGTQDAVGGVLHHLDDLERRLGGLLSTAARASR